MDLTGTTIAFDLDGTLVETAPDLIEAVNRALGAAGVPSLPIEAARPLISRGARGMLEYGLVQARAPNPAAQADLLLPRFLAHYEGHLADRSRAFPGVPDALEALRAAGASLVVCTNKPTLLATRLLDQLGLLHLFDRTAGPDSVSARKPEPAHLVETIASVGGRLDRALLVGDSDVDALCARAAGVPIILVSFGYSEIPASELAPNALIDHFDQLQDACRRLSVSYGSGETAWLINCMPGGKSR